MASVDWPNDVSRVAYLTSVGWPNDVKRVAYIMSLGLPYCKCVE